jgi:hypothetical protein
MRSPSLQHDLQSPSTNACWAQASVKIYSLARRMRNIPSMITAKERGSSVRNCQSRNLCFAIHLPDESAGLHAFMNHHLPKSAVSNLLIRQVQDSFIRHPWLQSYKTRYSSRRRRSTMGRSRSRRLQSSCRRFSQGVYDISTQSVFDKGQGRQDSLTSQVWKEPALSFRLLLVSLE